MDLTKMPMAAMVLCGIILLIFLSVDIVMLVSLIRPGDERNQIIVWKASAYTLLAITGGMVLNIIMKIAQSLPLTLNALVQLETTAIVYCIALLFFKRKYGG